MREFYDKVLLDLVDMRFCLEKTTKYLDSVERKVQLKAAEHDRTNTTPAAPTDDPDSEPGAVSGEYFGKVEKLEFERMCEGLRGHFDEVVKKARHVRKLQRMNHDGPSIPNVIEKLLKSIEAEDRLPEGHKIRRWATSNLQPYR